LREFGADPVSGRTVVAKDGRFGTYVTDGETNASLTRGDRLEHMSPERAFELLAARRANPPEPKKTKSPDTKTAPPKAAPLKTARAKTEPTKPKKKPARKRSRPKKPKKSDD
jgi:DNA topoisomerase-1